AGRAGPAPARGVARGDVGRAGARLRARAAADHGRRQGEPCAARHRDDVARRGARLPLALDELVAARPDAARPAGADRRGREGRARRVSVAEAQLETYVGEVVEAFGAPVAGVFVLGSALLGGFDPATSDVGLVVVGDEPLDSDAESAALDAAETTFRALAPRVMGDPSLMPVYMPARPRRAGTLVCALRCADTAARPGLARSVATGDRGGAEARGRGAARLGGIPRRGRARRPGTPLPRP